MSCWLWTKTQSTSSSITDDGFTLKEISFLFKHFVLTLTVRRFLSWLSSELLLLLFIGRGLQQVNDIIRPLPDSGVTLSLRPISLTQTHTQLDLHWWSNHHTLCVTKCFSFDFSSAGRRKISPYDDEEEGRQTKERKRSTVKLHLKKWFLLQHHTTSRVSQPGCCWLNWSKDSKETPPPSSIFSSSSSFLQCSLTGEVLLPHWT